MAYFFFLSVFPALLIVFALTGFVGGDTVFARITTIVRTLTPPDASAFLHRFIAELASERRPGMLSLGALVLFWGRLEWHRRAHRRTQPDPRRSRGLRMVEQARASTRDPHDRLHPYRAG